jgi:hypothetical protein
LFMPQIKNILRYKIILWSLKTSNSEVFLIPTLSRLNFRKQEFMKKPSTFCCMNIVLDQMLTLCKQLQPPKVQLRRLLLVEMQVELFRMQATRKRKRRLLAHDGSSVLVLLGCDSLRLVSLNLTKLITRSYLNTIYHLVSLGLFNDWLFYCLYYCKECHAKYTTCKKF